ncbi:hypothetical protein PC9H_002567 [Pleurotus ostreatus]|uniref:Uncharacterized protein n=1 Tax=Pleurotus ostreatus TaxID=5322 RepID=A0A8H6ZNQ9_PLEOS|nr:uncharacterized protein PC9H_002567 [Pleurotus ostreatus]KAF7416302.1 hypothetical protein PC9H_002567 [Pleurotus ostreatus]KAJ8689177.1 hypothetical protein PTI98_013228 [Pleurotus ostreatus]
MSSRKRKFRSKKARGDRTVHGSQDTVHEPDPALFIQAYEADLIHGSQARIAAAALEVTDAGAGSGLIRWGEDAAKRKPCGTTGSLNISDDAYFQSGSTDTLPSVWVDRYDARLLLESLPTQSGAVSEARAVSPSGWSDLPSDTEDTFFLDPDEIESYNRDKRRRILDRDREARLRALQELEIANGVEEDPWGGSDEEPDDDQKDLMRRTAKHIVTSPNAAQLEMRILANHGGDRRFAFLRGRWKLAWQAIKGRANMEKSRDDGEKEARPAGQKPGGLGGLTNYGDSEEDEGSGAEQADEAGPGDVQNDEEALKEIRRQKAGEWAQKRRESQST